MSNGAAEGLIFFHFSWAWDSQCPTPVIIVKGVMKTITSLIKSLKSTRSPYYQQLELPLSGRQLTRSERITVTRLQRLRERISML